MAKKNFKEVLMDAHKGNNATAISEEDFAVAGLTDQAFTQWTEACDGLRAAMVERQDVTLRWGASYQEFMKAEDAAFAAWRTCLKVAGIKLESRQQDMGWLFKAIARNVNTKVGAQFGHASSGVFRREVERYIGVRLCCSSVLTDEQAKVVEEYEAAVKTIAQKEKQLLGKTAKDGKHIPGLYDEMKAAEDAYSKTEKALDAFAEKMDILDSENFIQMKAESLAARAKAIKETRAAVAKAEDALDKATETRDGLQEKYDATLLAIQVTEQSAMDATEQAEAAKKEAAPKNAPKKAAEEATKKAPKRTSKKATEQATKAAKETA